MTTTRPGGNIDSDNNQPDNYTMFITPNLSAKHGPQTIWPPMLCFDGQIFTHHSNGRPPNLVGGTGNVHDKLVQYGSMRRAGYDFKETVFRKAYVAKRATLHGGIVQPPNHRQNG